MVTDSSYIELKCHKSREKRTSRGRMPWFPAARLAARTTVGGNTVGFSGQSQRQAEESYISLSCFSQHPRRQKKQHG
jgi:hypothetical protein